MILHSKTFKIDDITLNSVAIVTFFNDIELVMIGMGKLSEQYRNADSRRGMRGARRSEALLTAQVRPHCAHNTQPHVSYTAPQLSPQHITTPSPRMFHTYNYFELPEWTKLMLAS